MDFAKSENMVLFLRFLHLNVFVTRFWRIVKCQKTDAKSFTTKIKRTFDADGIGMSRLYCAATDGASVMTGCNAGVVVLLRLLCCAFLIACHCIAHREALAAAGAAEGNEVADYCEATMHDILNYHTRSALKTEHLETIQRELQVKRLRMVRWVKTRWLSRGASTKTIQRNLAPLAVEFERDKAKSATAGILHEAVTSHKFIVAITIFSDVLDLLNRLNKSFQVTSPVYSTIMTNIRAFIAHLEACYLGVTFLGGIEWGKMKHAIARGNPDSADAREIADADSGDEGVVFANHGTAADGAFYMLPGVIDSDEVQPIWRDVGDEEEVISGVVEFCSELKVGLETVF